MTSSRKIVISWMILIVLSFVIFGSSCFIITHAEHECTDEECSICIELAECHKTLNTLGTSFICSTHIALMIHALSLIVKIFIKTRSDHTTLISLKVELLN